MRKKPLPVYFLKQIEVQKNLLDDKSLLTTSICNLELYGKQKEHFAIDGEVTLFELC